MEVIGLETAGEAVRERRSDREGEGGYTEGGEYNGEISPSVTMM